MPDSVVIPSPELSVGPYSLGMGDRFSHQGEAQLAACAKAEAELRVRIDPVWNKSHREHTIIGSQPSSLWEEAENATTSLAWPGPWFVDADHIRLETVDEFADHANFFTIDVAEEIGEPASSEEVAAFVARHPELIGEISIDGIAEPVSVKLEEVEATALRFLRAVRQAGVIYERIAELKGGHRFVAEISMDETDAPQTPPELLVILAAIADEGIPIQTIAPKFTGRFNKGVDYVGDAAQFEKEFREDIAVIGHAVRSYGLPRNLKLSVHSGSDKFSLYETIGRVVRATGAGVHLKTAGTTWLEELIGLAEADGEGLDLAKEIYREALVHQAALCEPYATVIDIDSENLPSAETLDGWSSTQFQNALRHVPDHPEFNPDLRQLLHVGFKVAAKMEKRYLELLQMHSEVIAKNVTENLYERHLVRIFTA